MFSIYHFIWLFIDAAIIVASTIYLRRHKVSLKDLLTVCCIVCVLSELTKVFNVMKMVPSSDGTHLYPYMELNYLPLHLCSIQIIFIFYARFGNPNSGFYKKLLPFMYPSCIIGAIAALAMPSIFSTSIRPEQAFTSPMAYQFFLFHAMLIVLGLYIYSSGEIEITPKHYGSSMMILAVLAFLSIYVNSLLGSPTYVDGKLVSVDFVTNMFFTYNPPIPIALTKIWHWYLYLLVIGVLAAILVAIAFIPVFRRARKNK